MKLNLDTTPIFIVSACLLGLNTRYDGLCNTNPACIDMLKKSLCIPVCPEQLGGLSTPRAPARIQGGDGYDVLENDAQVLTHTGENVTSQFKRGAFEVLQIASLYPVQKVYLKSGSPSCGVKTPGVTAALLKNNGFNIQEL